MREDTYARLGLAKSGRIGWGFFAQQEIFFPLLNLDGSKQNYGKND